jgi:hypothetical protein
MNKIYYVTIIQDFLPDIKNNFTYIKSWAQEDHIIDYWKELGGIIPETHGLYLAGSNEIMTEFILTYQYSYCLTIKEIIQ